MRSQSRYSTQTIGVLAHSRERFQSIADFLKEPCVWLAEPAADAPAPIVDTFIIDSDLLAAEPARIRRWREHYRLSASRTKTDTRTPIHQNSAASRLNGERMYFEETTHQKPLVPPIKPGRIIIYQCSEHLDADNSVQNT